jgi:hypothetical protein
MYKVTYKNQCRLSTEEYLIPTEAVVGDFVSFLLQSNDRDEGIEITVRPTNTKYINEI